MYLLSLYFDEKTNQKICNLMKCVAERSGNTDMTDKAVPPHITLAVFESRESVEVLGRALDDVFCGVGRGRILWASVAAFVPHVLFLAPVLNEYLHTLSRRVFEALEKCNGTEVQSCYRPYNWQPHTTVGRKLSGQQMQEAFGAIQNVFQPFEGKVVRIGLSEGIGKKELRNWEFLSEEEEVVK